MDYMPGTHREVIVERISEAEAGAMLQGRSPRKGELMLAEVNDDGTRTVVVLSSGTRCSACGSIKSGSKAS